MTAVTTHKPTAAPLFAGFRQTENAVVVPLGEGMWKSVTALGKVQRKYLDAVSGQAAYYGIVEEGSSSAVVTVRVRVEDRKITEAEWYIARVGDPGLNGPAQPGQPPPNLFNPDGLAAAPPPDRVLPKAARASRELLLAITNSYFDGITSHNGSIVMADPRCDRMENGTAMGARGGGGGARGGGGAQGRGGQATPARRHRLSRPSVLVPEALPPSTFSWLRRGASPSWTKRPALCWRLRFSFGVQVLRQRETSSASGL